ncbi:MAG: heme-binding domain-containing protein [Oligoflexia bacterium]|nr:heme-binding domain-containing protein [Oligoflexia bacterium]
MKQRLLCRKITIRKSALATATLLVAALAFGHGKEHPREHSGGPALAAERAGALAASYVAKVKPIFAAKCYSCHAEGAKLPWYHPIPGVKQLIDRDIREAREHLDMSGDYPFRSHASPVEDLNELEEEIRSGGMPPLIYRAMHWGSRLTREEENVVLDWLRSACGALPATSARAEE